MSDESSAPHQADRVVVKSITLSVREQIQLSPDSVFVFHPRYANADKSKIRAIVRFPDGRLSEVEADVNDLRSPLIRDVFSQYTADEIQLFTDRQSRLSEVRRVLENRIQEDKRIASEREAVALAKAEALKILEISDPANKALRYRIRKAKTAFEVNALATLALWRSMEANGTLDNLPDDEQNTL